MDHRSESHDGGQPRIRRTRVVALVEPADRDEPTPQPALATRKATGGPRTVVDATAPPVALERITGAPTSTGATRSRRTTQARRIRPSDTALVEATTQMLAVVEPIPLERALVPLTPELPVSLEDSEDPLRSEREPLTIVEATLTPETILRLGAPRRVRPPSRLKLGLLWSVAGVCVLGVVLAALPLVSRPTQPLPTSPVLQRLNSSYYTAPTGPWSTGAGVADLGLGGGAAPGVKAPGSAGAPVSKQQQAAATSHAKSPGPSATSGVRPAPVSPWPPHDPFMYVPGHPAFGIASSGGYYWWAFGQCTWWAQYKKQNENLTHMGNAMYWASSAAARGYRTGGVPRAGSTVVLQPGVQGAGGAGHVAHVEAVYPGGWFLMSEMNFYVNGGGWGRVDYRFAHSGWGVTFIY